MFRCRPLSCSASRPERIIGLPLRPPSRRRGGDRRWVRLGQNKPHDAFASRRDFIDDEAFGQLGLDIWGNRTKGCFFDGRGPFMRVPAGMSASKCNGTASCDTHHFSQPRHSPSR